MVGREIQGGQVTPSSPGLTRHHSPPRLCCTLLPLPRAAPPHPTSGNPPNPSYTPATTAPAASATTGPRPHPPPENPAPPPPASLLATSPNLARGDDALSVNVPPKVMRRVCTTAVVVGGDHENREHRQMINRQRTERRG